MLPGREAAGCLECLQRVPALQEYVGDRDVIIKLMPKVQFDQLCRLDPLLRCKLERLTKKYHGVEEMTGYPDICIFVDEDCATLLRSAMIGSYRMCGSFQKVSCADQRAKPHRRDGAHRRALHWPHPCRWTLFRPKSSVSFSRPISSGMVDSNNDPKFVDIAIPSNTSNTKPHAKYV